MKVLFTKKRKDKCNWVNAWTWYVACSGLDGITVKDKNGLGRKSMKVLF